MKQTKRKISLFDLLLVVLLVAVVTLAVLLCVANWRYLPVAAGVVLLAFLLCLLVLRRYRRRLRRILNVSGSTAGADRSAAAGLQLPALAVQKDEIIWYNNAFLQRVMGGSDCCLLPLGRVLPQVQPELACAPHGQDIQVGQVLYTVYGNQPSGAPGLLFYLFAENTQLKMTARAYEDSRPTVMYFYIDTYDDVLQEMRDSERAVITTRIDAALETYIEKSNGFLRKMTPSRYLAVVDESAMRGIVEARFSILDEVRGTEEDAVMVSLSIGAGSRGQDFRECEDMARQALDMALGRGGDQAAVRYPDGYEFFGGVLQGVEKHTKVKSRITSNAIRDLVLQSDRVLVMGHKSSDMDAVGAAVGMLRFAKLCDRPASVVVDYDHSMAQLLLDRFHTPEYKGDFLTPEEALPLAGPNTLLVVVDTHVRHLLESQAVYEKCGQVVVIDHHRKMVGHIDNAVVFYHEIYASSASELVTELLQYMPQNKQNRLMTVEADALLSGIMLDTRTFSLHVGVRTFEAAAYLRRMGAQTEQVKKFFATSMDEYICRSHLVAEAQVYLNCAVVCSDQIPAGAEVAAPQAANDLLGIEGVDASFVGIQVGSAVHLSARSMGAVNVQVIMERLGGGGHLTMAGAQLPDTDCEAVYWAVMHAIEEYRSEQQTEKQSEKGRTS